MCCFLSTPWHCFPFLLLHISPFSSLAAGCIQFDARIHFPCSCASTLRDFSTSCLRLESSSGNSTECARVSLLKASSTGTLEVEVEVEEKEKEMELKEVEQ